MSQHRAKVIRKEARKEAQRVMGEFIPIEARSAMYWFKRMPLKERLKIAWKIVRGARK